MSTIKFLPVFFFIIIMYFFVVFTFTSNVNPIKNNVSREFYESIEQNVGFPLTDSPLNVSIFELMINNDEEVGYNPSKHLSNPSIYDKHFYNPRLISMKPKNYLIYTHNGIDFFYIISNINNNNSQCVENRSLNSIKFTLKKDDGLNETDGERVSAPQKLKFHCINYNMSELIKIFGENSRHTTIDITAIFDKKKDSSALDYTVYNVLNVLIRNNII